MVLSRHLKWYLNQVSSGTSRQDLNPWYKWHLLGTYQDVQENDNWGSDQYLIAPKEADDRYSKIADYGDDLEPKWGEEL